MATTLDEVVRAEAGALLGDLNEFLGAQQLWPLLLGVSRLSEDALPPLDAPAPPPTPKAASPERRPRPPAAPTPSPPSAGRSPAFRRVEATWL